MGTRTVTEEQTELLRRAELARKAIVMDGLDPHIALLRVIHPKPEPVHPLKSEEYARLREEGWSHNGAAIEAAQNRGA